MIGGAGSDFKSIANKISADVGLLSGGGTILIRGQFPPSRMDVCPNIRERAWIEKQCVILKKKYLLTQDAVGP